RGRLERVGLNVRHAVLRAANLHARRQRPGIRAGRRPRVNREPTGQDSNEQSGPLETRSMCPHETCLRVADGTEQAGPAPPKDGSIATSQLSRQATDIQENGRPQGYNETASPAGVPPFSLGRHQRRTVAMRSIPLLGTPTETA